MKQKFKPTPKKILVSTIGRDYEAPKNLREPYFEDASKREVSFGSLSDILDGKLPNDQVEEEPVIKRSIWEVIKYFVPVYNYNRSLAK